jgi:hypothetical protein
MFGFWQSDNLKANRWPFLKSFVDKEQCADWRKRAVTATGVVE